MFKAGRWTAALVLLTVGILLIVDQTTGSRWMDHVMDWWPLVLIALGLEYIIMIVIARKKGGDLRLEIGTLVFAFLLAAAATVLSTTGFQPDQWLQRLNLSIDASNPSYASESGHRFGKEKLILPVTRAGKTIIENPNGSLELRTGNVEAIEIETVVYVDKVDEATASNIAEQSRLEVTEGSTLVIKAVGEPYTGEFSNKRLPKMNLIVTVPASYRSDYDIRLRNGKIVARDLPVVEKLKAVTTNGTITLSGIDGHMIAETTNGTVDISHIRGSVQAATTNGQVQVADVTKEVAVETTNGAVTVEQATGKVKVNTTNGSITIREAASGIEAEAMVGGITVFSKEVGGDYRLKTTGGIIQLSIPDDADVTIRGSTLLYGGISTDLPLAVQDREVTGTMGDGTHDIRLEANLNVKINNVNNLQQTWQE